MKQSLKRLRAEKKRREMALRDNLERIKAYLIDRGALKVVLFGSFIDNLEHPNGSRGARRGTDLDILAYTEQELEKTIPVSGFLRRALETGMVIYETRPKG